MAEPTVGVMQLVDLLKALRRLGADPTQLCRAVGLAPAALRDLGSRANESLVHAILHEAERRLHDPLVGLHAGEKARPRGALAYLVLSCPRLEWAMHRCSRFSHLADEALRMSLHRRGALAHFVVVHQRERPGRYPHVIDYAVLAVVKSIRSAVGSAVGMPSGMVVHLRHPARHDPAEFQRAFGCPVRFECPTNALVFPASVLAKPSRFVNPLVAERIEDLAIALEARAAHATLRGRVSDVVRAMTVAGVRADRVRVARKLGMSERTLQRPLGREGATFKAVRDEVRWDGVPALFANPACTVEEAALSAGFADVAGFSRAFTRRMGCSPSRYRARLAG